MNTGTAELCTVQEVMARLKLGRSPSTTWSAGKTWAECDAKRCDLLAKVDQEGPVPTRSAKFSECTGSTTPQPGWLLAS